MPKFSDEEFLEKSSIHTLIASSRSTHRSVIEFTCMEPGGREYTYKIPREDVLAELAKRKKLKRPK